MFLTDLLRRNTQIIRHVLDHVLGHERTLGSTKSTEGSVGYSICFANLSSGSEVGEVIGIVGVE